MPIYIYDCEKGHANEKRYAVTCSRRDIKCPEIINTETLEVCGLPAKRREVYAANINMGKDGTRNRV